MRATLPEKFMEPCALSANGLAKALAIPRHEHERQVWKTGKTAERRRLMPGLTRGNA